MNVFQLLFIGAVYWHVVVIATLVCIVCLYLGEQSLWWSTPLVLYSIVCVLTKVLYQGPQ